MQIKSISKHRPKDMIIDIPEEGSTYSIGRSVLRWLKGWFIELDVSRLIKINSNSSSIDCNSDNEGAIYYLNKEKTSWDYCKTGWILITDDLIIQEEPKNETIKEINNITEGISSGVYPIQYLCDTTKCVLKH